jgi:hypothetical protein
MAVVLVDVTIYGVKGVYPEGAAAGVEDAPRLVGSPVRR